MATKTFKIGLSNTDKQNMAQDVYERLLDLTFAEYNSSQTYNTGDFVVYNDALYQCLEDNVTGTWDATKWQSATLQDLLDDVEGAVASVNGKANTIDLLNGTLVVAKSLSTKSIENISEDSGSTQDDPFIAQGTGTNNNTSEVSTSPVAKQLEKQGNTIVRNQLLSYTNFVLNNSDITKTSNHKLVFNNVSISQFEGITVPATIANGIKYLVYVRWIPATGNAGNFYWYEDNQIRSTSVDEPFIRFAVFEGSASSQQLIIRTYATSGSNYNGTLEYSLHNLDQWNLSSDVITRLTSHPEEWLNYDCTDDSYNTGEIKNANGVTLVTIKKNIWDEQWEQGSINETTGEATSNASRGRSKNFIRVIPNKDFYFKKADGITTNQIFFYDKDKNYLGYYIDLAQGGVFTIPSNCIYIKFRYGSSTQPVTSYNHDISIYLVYWKDNDDHSQGMDGDHYNTYLPYEKHEYNTGSEVLRSAGSVKDYKDPDGTINRLVGAVDLSTLSFTNDSYSGKAVALTGCKHPSDNWTLIELLNEKYSYISYGSYTSNTSIIEVCAIDTSGNIHVRSANNPNGNVNYELAEPTTEQGTSFPENIEVDDYGVMYWLDGDGNFVTTPQGCKFFYPADYVLLIDDLNNYTNGDVTILAKKSDVHTAPNTYLTSLAGYDATKTQTLKNVNGVFTWVDD